MRATQPSFHHRNHGMRDIPKEIDQFTSIWVCDTEFVPTPGNIPKPVCLVATELMSGKTVRLWSDEMQKLSSAPFDVGPNSLFVAYFATAELSVFNACGWPLPTNILDLFLEFRLLTNGFSLIHGKGLIGAMLHLGLKPMTPEDKDANRDLIIGGGPWTVDDQRRILEYCEADVLATKELFNTMKPGIDFLRAQYFRGNYCKAVAEIEYTGIPIDETTLERIQSRWSDIQNRLIEKVNQIIPVYEGRNFRTARFIDWLNKNKIAWPLNPNGELALDDETFGAMAKKHPQIVTLRELRANLSKLQTKDLSIGKDGRNRVMLSPFQSKTGRNQPSTSKFVFGGSKWMRSLISPEHGKFLAYIDWSSQEIGIAAKLSEDLNLMDAYLQDPYMWFAKRVGAVPPDATKSSHKVVRTIYKETMLAVGYGMGLESLAQKIDHPVAKARTLLQQHKETFPNYWKWSESVVNHALLRQNI